MVLPTDESLVERVLNKDKQAEAIFYKRYYEYSKRLGSSYYFDYKRTGISEDEFIAVAFSVTAIAVKAYKFGTCPFYFFWKRVANNAIRDYIRENSYTLGAKEYGDMSLDAKRYSDNDVITIGDTIGKDDEEDIINNDLAECLKNYIYNPKSDLNNEETLTAHFLFYRQYDVKEIMKATNWNKQKTYRLIRNVRNKISVYLKNRYF